jgi:hypothetical protein
VLLALIGQALAGTLDEIGQQLRERNLIGQHHIDPPLCGGHGDFGEHVLEIYHGL